MFAEMFAYAVSNNTTTDFYQGDKVFDRNRPDMPLVVLSVDRVFVTCGWFTEYGIFSKQEFLPSMLLHYMYAGLLIYKDKWQICLN